ncbi:hypothetical protein SAMN05443572_113208 [Myxococcus fulvus]|uniref:Uncharacterized protein n=1 Tax=Myxococcus fulvus TaxID=33 RepID=A0A511TFF8_MYXFU|nr:hypothetical protein [Myxococcus fulvus]GEN11918.1 hypothetical protein MFU01_69550 [Myxococcus fulvus]SEU38812.1 hypothetical protein SAMN05443572_113208 [Myxococcus fulvus]
MASLGVSKENLLSRGAARFKDLVYLALQDKKLHKKEVAHTRLGSIDEGELANVKDLPWRAAGMCVAKQPTEKLVVVSGDGQVFTYVGGKEGTEQIPKPHELRGCTRIAGHAYGFGMNREVFRREGDGRWRAMHAPQVQGEQLAGFEALDGFTEHDLYAAGWEGEVWHWDSGAWTQCPSPTRVILSALCCAGDGQVYAGGQSGTLLRGRGPDWTLLEAGGSDDIWDLRWFMGRLYVATLSALYVLDGESLVAVDFGREKPKSAYKLTDAEGVLWAIGQKNIFSFDGAKWRRWE